MRWYIKAVLDRIEIYLFPTNCYNLLEINRLCKRNEFPYFISQFVKLSLSLKKFIFLYNS